MKKLLNVFQLLTLVLFIFTINACTKDSIEYVESTTDEQALERSSMPDVEYFALTHSGMRIEKFSTHDAGDGIYSKTFVGLASGEKMLAIDFRPATGQLYGVSNMNKLYTIDVLTGMITSVGTAPFTPALLGGVTAFDFNPTVDRIRLITGSGQNLRLHPVTGVVAFVDGSINGQPVAQINAVAYTNNMAGATTTELFGIDRVSKMLFKIAPPNNGTLMPVGALNISGTIVEGGFDISGTTALALLRVGSRTNLYSIDLATGMATRIHKYKSGRNFLGLAIPIP